MKNEFKGTPGPWKWTDDLMNEGNALDGGCGAYVFWGDNICSGIDSEDGWGARLGATNSDAESEANAQLIAASPDLLSALQSLVEIYDNDGSRLYTTETKQRALDKAKVAIDKALGGGK